MPLPLVVLDTNVIVSAMLKRTGNPHLIVDACLNNQFSVVWALPILAEYREVLSRPRFKFDPADVESLVEYFEISGEEIKPKLSTVKFSDEDDRIFYDTAQQAGALLITGNSRHFPTVDWVVSPADFGHRYLRV